MADSPTEEVAGSTSEPNCNDKAENEVDESLDDFLRDTNDLLTNSNEGNSNSPDSSGDGEGEKRKNIWNQVWAQATIQLLRRRVILEFPAFIQCATIAWNYPNYLCRLPSALHRHLSLHVYV